MNRNYGFEQDRDYPDHSEYLWHLTSNRDPLSSARFGDAERNAEDIGNSRKRLASILLQPGGARIWCSHLHYMSPGYHNLEGLVRCVCFTECIPHSLLIHARRFSRWGLLFKKSVAYRLGARPAWYMDAALMNRFAQCNIAEQRNYKECLPFPEELLHLLIPFVPSYGKYRMGGKTLDFSVEREWRVAGDFQFIFNDLAAIIVPTSKDMDSLLESIPSLQGVEFVVSTDLQNVQFEHKDFGEYFYRKLHRP